MSNDEKIEFKDDFVGSKLKEQWISRDFLGRGHYMMKSKIGGELEITCDSLPSSKAQIDFDNITNFSANSSIFKTKIKKHQKAGTAEAGFINDVNETEKQMISLFSATTGGMLYLASADEKKSKTDTNIAVHTNYDNVEIKSFEDRIELILNGELKVTKTNNLPDLIQQPFISISTPDRYAKSLSIRYVEAYNT